DWLAEVSLVADSDQLPDEVDHEGEVTLMTVHTAKGLEFPVVFVTGMEDGTFPHMRSLSTEDELAEERRLAYVALTRAQKRLFLSRAAVRSAWGSAQHFPPSRFLEEIPEDLIEWEREESSMQSLFSSDDWGYGSRQSYGRHGGSSQGYGRGSASLSRGFGSRDFDDDFSSPLGAGKKRQSAPFKPGKLGASSSEKPGKATSSAADTMGLKVGDSVRHKSFGRGTILEFEGQGKSTVAKVRFSSGNVKRLMLRYAPLEKI
ncbi:MAG: ATP-binding domain-containing protein, partial [Actinomycetaceae bacterium]|nr:ATP-binding domain-containing protein [Actinomycetaceae bacterium]